MCARALRGSCWRVFDQSEKSLDQSLMRLTMNPVYAAQITASRMARRCKHSLPEGSPDCAATQLDAPWGTKASNWAVTAEKPTAMRYK